VLKTQICVTRPQCVNYCLTAQLPFLKPARCSPAIHTFTRRCRTATQFHGRHCLSCWSSSSPKEMTKLMAQSSGTASFFQTVCTKLCWTSNSTCLCWCPIHPGAEIFFSERIAILTSSRVDSSTVLLLPQSELTYFYLCISASCPTE